MRLGLWHCFLIILIFFVHVSTQGKICKESKACRKMDGKCFPRKSSNNGYIETKIKCKCRRRGRCNCRCFKPIPPPCNVKPQGGWIPLSKNPCFFNYNGENRTLSGPNCDDSPKERIGVVGAGMAGLTLSWILRYIGHEVLLLEASDRIGGRVHTFYGDGWYGDLGAMRFPDNKVQPLTHFIINKFLGDNALDFFTNYNQGSGSYFKLNGKYYSSEAYQNDNQDILKEIYELFEIDDSNPLLRNGTSLINPSDVLQKKILETDKEIHTNPVKACIYPQSLEAYLRRRLKTLNGPEKLINLWSVLLLQRAFLPMSLWEYLNNEPEEMEEKARRRRNEGEEGAQFHEIINGTSQLPEAIFNNLKSQENFAYRLNSIVTEASIQHGKVDLRIKDFENRCFNGVKQGCEETEGFDKVIIATTSRAASLMKFYPPLPYSKKYALDSFHYVNSVKVFLHFTEPFWNSTTNGNTIGRIPYGCSPGGKPDECGGTGITDLSMRSIYYPSNILHGTSLLVSYVWGDDDAGRLTAIPEADLVQRALDDLAKIHGDVVYTSFINDASNYKIKKWVEDEYVGGGAFPWGYPYQVLHMLDALRTNTPPLYFAGEYTEKKFHGWIQAAVASACRVALEMFG